MVYLDNAATTKPYDEVIELMGDIAKNCYYNPSSHHFGGYMADKVLRENREMIAEMLGARSSEIYFTSGGSESNNWALTFYGRLCAAKGKKHIICSSIEHHSILNKIKQLEKVGFDVTYVNPNSNGIIEISSIEREIKDNTGLVILMAVNNELGTIQPYKEVGEICKKKKIYFHVDGVQGAPHIKFSLDKLGITSFSISAHKFHGPRGVGLLYVKETVSVSPLIFGGNQEGKKRAGTENLPGIVGMRKALEIIQNSILNKVAREYYDYLTSNLSSIKNCVINSLFANDKVHTIVSFYFPDILGEVMLSMLNQKDIYASAGAACAAGDSEPSHVLKAIGLTNEQAKNTIRLSFDYDITYEELDEVIHTIEGIVDYIRRT